MLAIAVSEVTAPVMVTLLDMTDSLNKAGASLMNREVTVGVLLAKVN